MHQPHAKARPQLGYLREGNWSNCEPARRICPALDSSRQISFAPNAPPGGTNFEECPWKKSGPVLKPQTVVDTRSSLSKNHRYELSMKT